MRRIAAVLAVCLIGLFLVSTGAGPLSAVARAQETTTAPDYAAWETVATRVEAVLEEAKASTGALEDLRAEVVDWREQFTTAQAANNSRIKTLRDQISALGEPPADGAEEPRDIADRRAELQSQLARAEAPRLKAEEAYLRADGLVKEIDTIVRERQAERLLKLGPSPLNPAHWATAFGDLGSL